MPKSALFWQVYERLVDDEEIDPLPRRLVEGSFDGESTIRDALETEATGLAAESSAAEEIQTEAPAVYLDTLEVTGFRGVGPTTTIDFDAGPGLTVVIGRNGSGKSSIAEALEVLLTGDSLRWKSRNQKDWLSGWKNLHHDGRTWVRGTFLVDGSPDPLQIQRSWDTAEFEQVELTGDDDRLAERWDEALETFRPILSYNEIGHALDEGPSHLYDLLRGVLGMEELTEARDRLGAVRRDLKKADKERKARQKTLEEALAKSDDPRTERATEALKGRNPDIDALTELVIEEETGDEEVAGLRRVATLRLPESDAVLSAAESLREAADAMGAANEKLADEEGETLALLRQALSVHEHAEDETCPVCGTEGVLTDAWRQQATERVEAQEASSKARRKAKSALDTAVRSADKLIGSVPAVGDVELDAAEPALAARESWIDSPDAPRALADHLEERFDEVEAAYATLRSQADERLRSLQAEWRPIRRNIEAFIDAAEEWAEAKVQIKALKAAETWLKEADGELRIERFEPIKDQSRAIWEELRHRSNVSLNDIRLEGTKTRRRVELEVAVDGEDAEALGVMSQGELHAMLLSLFLPRLTLDESPFRFLVVDDPVQAMDPAKVDGLAQVLSDVAEKRQVIVFTHDARLPEALRRMQLPARIVEVNRAENSVVTLRDTRSRPKQFLDDAWQVADEQSKFGPRVAGDVVPGLCRGAMEAFLQAKTWERLLREGKEHTEIEETIANTNGVHNLAALAFFGDTNQSSEVYRYLNNKASGGTDTFKTLKDGAHGGFRGDVRGLIQDTQRLLRALGAPV